VNATFRTLHSIVIHHMFRLLLAIIKKIVQHTKERALRWWLPLHS